MIIISRQTDENNTNLAIKAVWKNVPGNIKNPSHSIAAGGKNRVIRF